MMNLAICFNPKLSLVQSSRSDQEFDDQILILGSGAVPVSSLPVPRFADPIRHVFTGGDEYFWATSIAASSNWVICAFDTH